METQTSANPAVPFDFSPERPVALSAKAVEMVKEAIASQKLENHLLRIAVVGGGCSGLNYDLDLVREAKPTDLIYDLEGLKLAVDAMSSRFLEGTVVDYVSTIQGSGFKFHNPKAKASCGCGSSFSV